MNAHAAYLAGLTAGPMGQHQEEIIPFLAWIAAGQPKVIAEIGVKHGALSRAFCDIASERVIGIDWPEGPGGLCDPEAAVRRDERLAQETRGKYVGILGQSQDPSVLNRARELGPIDVLFIDGDHDGGMPERDYDAYLPLVRTGGIVAFHDLHSPAHPDIEGLFEKLRWRHAGCVEFWARRGWGGIGALFV